MNTEIQPDPNRTPTKPLNQLRVNIVGSLLDILRGAAVIFRSKVFWIIVLVMSFLIGFSISGSINDAHQGKLLTITALYMGTYIFLHTIFVPQKTKLAERFHFLHGGAFNYLAVSVIINIIVYGLGVFTHNHPLWLKDESVAIVVDGKPVTDTDWKYVNPFKQDVQKIGSDLSLKDVPVKGKTKDGVPIQALVDIQLRRADKPEYWLSPDRLNPKLEDVIRNRFIAACSAVTSGEIASSGLKLEFETGRDSSSPENTLPNAVQRNGEIVVKNIHVYFRD